VVRGPQFGKRCIKEIKQWQTAYVIQKFIQRPDAQVYDIRQSAVCNTLQINEPKFITHHEDII
jgi:hypothetical protein